MLAVLKAVREKTDAVADAMTALLSRRTVCVHASPFRLLWLMWSFSPSMSFSPVKKPYAWVLFSNACISPFAEEVTDDE